MKELSEDARLLEAFLRTEWHKGTVRDDKRMTGDDIAQRHDTNLPDAKKWNSSVKVRQLVSELCKASYPICSNDKGYCYGTTTAEIDETIAHRLSRIKEQMDAVSGLRIARKRLEEYQMKYQQQQEQEALATQQPDIETSPKAD